MSTVELDLRVKRVETTQGQRVRLHLWDTVGQERYNAVSAKFYRGTNGVVLVYDVTDRKSFENLQLWIDSVENNCRGDVLRILVGNKVDCNGQREVPKLQAKKLAESLKIPYIETSAKDDINIQGIFAEVITEVITHPTLNRQITDIHSKKSVDPHFCACCR